MFIMVKLLVDICVFYFRFKVKTKASLVCVGLYRKIDVDRNNNVMPARRFIRKIKEIVIKFYIRKNILLIYSLVLIY